MLSSTDSPREETGLLVRAREPESRALSRGEAGDVAVEHLHRSARCGEIARDDVEERGLPGTVRAENRPTLPVPDVEIDVGHCLETPEPPADPPQAEGRLGVFQGLCYFAQRPT